MLKSTKKHEEKTEQETAWKDKWSQSKEKYMESEEGKTKRYKT